MDLPTFRYHPNPLATGSVRAGNERCMSCEESRGYVYVGPVYTENDLDDAICPWCIASGDAHVRLGAEFTDAGGVGGYGDWATVPNEVVVEVATRTPGFTGWQQERWWTHCNDAAEFLGPAGAAEVARHGAATVEHLRLDLGWPPGQEFDDYVAALDANGQPTAHLFRCRGCGEVGGYSDCA